MRFRPCIDIHNGKVKQIVGGSLRDLGDQAEENFVSELDAAFYGELYRRRGIKGGHVILLNSETSPLYEESRQQARGALEAFPGGLMIGGGIHPGNAACFLDLGASHVIVTSYVFKDGKINRDRLKDMVSAVGTDRLCLDLSCRKKGNAYYVVTDRWQTFTEERVDLDLLEELAASCREFLVHGVDVEGKSAGLDWNLIKILSGHGQRPITYAGGIGSYQDLYRLKELGRGRLDVTVGSCLDLFGGSLDFEKVLEICS